MSAPGRGPRIRHVADGDWDALVALEAAAYAPSGLSEGRAPLESMVRASPSTCFVLHQGARLAAYALALPYPESAYPALAATGAAARASSNLHLHDLVVAADLRGRGLGRHLFGHLAATALAQGYLRISLVAVGGSDTFWAARGFAPHPEIALAADYGPGALYMSRPVTAGHGPARTRGPAQGRRPVPRAASARVPGTPLHHEKG
ncbi:GNAT family N-acetyltransferase [Streptomyces sp. NPDC047002]|uniref:GNAT family N-acetyltransferase n=1 Tax=Streptomyces sp. NPDC047002 TaxID=3155475 RepID=UPI003456B50F